jgi:hypothetical protein
MQSVWFWLDLVCGTDEAFPMGDGIEAMGLPETLRLLHM